MGNKGNEAREYEEKKTKRKIKIKRISGKKTKKNHRAETQITDQPINSTNWVYLSRSTYLYTFFILMTSQNVWFCGFMDSPYISY